MSFSARGAEHSERNNDPDRRLRFLQFWILADRADIDNSVHQAQTTKADRTDRWLTIMSPVGEEGLDLQQDARVRVSRVGAGTDLRLDVVDGRAAYLYVIDGAVTVNSLSGTPEEQLATGDAMVLAGAVCVTVTGALAVSELWIADVPLDFTPHGVWAGHRH